jgi:hypothetical protein
MKNYMKDYKIRKHAAIYVPIVVLFLLASTTAYAGGQGIENISFCSLAYKKFPDLKEKAPSHTAYWHEKDIFWEIYDLDGNEVPDVATGYKPTLAVPSFVMTVHGMAVIWQVDIEGVAATYYWTDLDGDGIPFGEDVKSRAEILHDPKEDGFNGNEKIAFKAKECVSL